MGSFLFSFRAWRRWWRVIFWVSGADMVRDCSHLKGEEKSRRSTQMNADFVQRASAEAEASSKSLPSAARVENLPVDSSKTKPYEPSALKFSGSVETTRTSEDLVRELLGAVKK